jgi:hydroxysqualene dehydroxylase
MMPGTVHIVGAGLAGLSAAVELAGAGRRVVVHESGPFAGGRCRSYYDSVIDLTIDNGNHLLLSGNRSALAYLERVGARNRLQGAAEAAFPFADLATGERWVLKPNAGRLPWWIFQSSRRVPGSRVPDYFAPVGILRARAGQRVGDVMDCAGPLYQRLWRPVLLAALNTDPCEADAGLAGQILRETLGAGGQACRPLVAVDGLTETFIEPALRYIKARGGAVRTGNGVREIRFGHARAEALRFSDETLELAPEDAVVLAVPAPVARALLPGLSTPERFHSIANAHFRIAPPPGQPLILGVVNGVTEWLFAYPDRLSVTISCADRLMDLPRPELAQTIWREVAALTGLAPDLPRWQIVRERRATFSATPEETAKRPDARTRFANLALAGDWTATGLPSTIEGSIRSGVAAAAALRMAASAAATRPAA